MTIDDIGKKMPFKEDANYVPLLLAGATERAIRSKRAMSRNRPLIRIAAMLVILLTVGSTGWLVLNHQKAKNAPLDTFLDNMTDEELTMLQDYCEVDVFEEDWEWEDAELYIN